MRTRILTFVLSYVAASFAYAQTDDDLVKLDYNAKETTAVGIAGVWDGARQVTTEAPFFKAYFTTYENTKVEIDAGKNQARYATLLFNCTMNHSFLGKRFSQLPTQERLAYKRLLLLMVVSNDIEKNSAAPEVPENVLPCDLNAWKITESVYTPLGPTAYVNVMKRLHAHLNFAQLFSAPDSSHVFGKYPDWIESNFKRWRSAFGITLSGLTSVYLLDRFGDAFGLRHPEISSKFPSLGKPQQIFFQKTTPSLEYNNQLAAISSSRPSWEQLGMNQYWASGYTPVHSWLARTKYNHPVLTTFIPIIGPAWEAADAAASFYEGRDAHGASQGRLYSSCLFALNFVFAAFDVTGLKSASAGSYLKLRDLAIAGRSAGSAAEAYGLLQRARKLLGQVNVGGKAVGQQVASDITRLGSPVKWWKSLEVRALGFNAAKSAQYGRMMYPALKRASALAKKVSRGAKISYDSIIETIAQASKTVAHGMKHQDAVHYGTLRRPEEVWMTPIFNTGRYDQFFESLREFARRGVEFKDYRAWDNHVRNGWTHQVVGKLPDGEEIPLTMVAVFDEPVSTVDGLYKGLIRHWSNELSQVQRVRQHLDTLMKKAMDLSTPRREVVELVAEIHWWEANLTAYRRGSNGIADAVSKSLLMARGIRVGRWLPDVSADFKAFTMSLEDFKSAYPSFFERTADAPLLAAPRLLNGKMSFDTTKMPSVGLAGKLIVTRLASGMVNLNGWASDNAEFLPDEGIGESQDGTQMAISIRTVASDGKEEEVALLIADAATPSEAFDEAEPARIKNQNKQKHGYQWLIPQDYLQQKLRVYVVNYMFPQMEKHIGTYLPQVVDDPNACKPRIIKNPTLTVSGADDLVEEVETYQYTILWENPCEQIRHWDKTTISGRSGLNGVFTGKLFDSSESALVEDDDIKGEIYTAIQDNDVELLQKKYGHIQWEIRVPAVAATWTIESTSSRPDKYALFDPRKTIEGFYMLAGPSEVFFKLRTYNHNGDLIEDVTPRAQQVPLRWGDGSGYINNADPLPVQTFYLPLLRPCRLNCFQQSAPICKWNVLSDTAQHKVPGETEVYGSSYKCAPLENVTRTKIEGNHQMRSVMEYELGP